MKLIGENKKPDPNKKLGFWEVSGSGLSLIIDYKKIGKLFLNGVLLLAFLYFLYKKIHKHKK